MRGNYRLSLKNKPLNQYYSHGACVPNRLGPGLCPKLQEKVLEDIEAISNAILRSKWTILSGS